MKHALVITALLFLFILLLPSCRQQIAPPTNPNSLPATAANVTAIVHPSSDSVSGIVLDPQGAPLAGATVRVQSTDHWTLSNAEGHFVLEGLETNHPVTLSAWIEGHYCAKVETLSPPANDVTFNMRLIQLNDNPGYTWIAPTGENSCYSCKPELTQVWLDNDAHGRSATNLRFLTMYNGTDVNGNQSPLTHYGNSRDYGRVPLLPDPTQPYYGPGYKLDFPTTAGNCSACHIPGAAIDAPYETDPNTVTGANSFGIHCDYCHKIADVSLDPQTGLPSPNMPGVLSQDIRRPFSEDAERYQLFFGSFDDDNVPLEDTYLPLIKQSQWCAPCHYGVFWDTLIYNSFGEWLASPYSDPITGKACQQCHMPTPTVLDNQPLTNVAAGKGGVERDPLSIPAHTFPGASSTNLLQNSVTMEVTASRSADNILVIVNIINDRTGHSIPTDSPLRQMILLVDAQDAGGKALTQVAGLTVPEWAGVGNPAQGYYAGLPGTGYAKILIELWTEVTPTAAYWNPTRLVSDNRIPALASDTNNFDFLSPTHGMVKVNVRLIFRRAFIDLATQKGWQDPDVLMESQTIELAAP